VKMANRSPRLVSSLLESDVSRRLIINLLLVLAPHLLSTHWIVVNRATAVRAWRGGLSVVILDRVDAAVPARGRVGIRISVRWRGTQSSVR